MSSFSATSIAQFKYIDFKKRNYEELPLNTVLKSEIGDKLITTGEEEFQEALKIVEIPEFNIDFSLFFSLKYPNLKGQILPLTSFSDKWLLYYNKKDIVYHNDGSDFYFGVAVSKKNSAIILPFIKTATNNNVFKTKEVEGFKTISEIYINNDCYSCFKQEFIYNGKVGTNLKFVYREYINDMARPAFNQDLQYDLNESNVVGFKGLRLEIINATNTNIEYKILSSFNKMK